jgi:hypothetical protein
MAKLVIKNEFTLVFSYFSNFLAQYCKTALKGQPKTAKTGQQKHDSQDKTCWT